MHFKSILVVIAGLLACANGAAIRRGEVEARQVAHATTRPTSIASVKDDTVAVDEVKSEEAMLAKSTKAPKIKTSKSSATTTTVTSTGTSTFPTTTSTFTTTYTSVIGRSAASTTYAVNMAAVPALALGVIASFLL